MTTTLERDELGKLKTLFGDASNNRSFDTYSMQAISSTGDTSNPSWNKVRDYMNQLASKYNHDPATFSINPNTGEVTASR